MVQVTVLAVGPLKEKFFREAVDEYKKRFGGSSKISEIEIREEKLPDSPSEAQINAALEKEADRIIEQIPKRSYVISMCIEGKQLTSEEFSSILDNVSLKGKSSVCFIIGSSHGLSNKVKALSDFKMSMSKLTFPHKLARVILFEAIYRANEISIGSKYHK